MDRFRHNPFKVFYLSCVHVTFQSISHTRVTNTFVELPVSETKLSRVILASISNISKRQFIILYIIQGLRIWGPR